jgi:hypothetical protein
LNSILTKSTPNPVCGFVDNSLAKSRQRTGPLAVDKSQKTATYPPRDPLPTSSTDHLGFDMQFESQNQTLRLIPLLELTARPKYEESHFNGQNKCRGDFAGFFGNPGGGVVFNGGALVRVEADPSGGRESVKGSLRSGWRD